MLLVEWAARICRSLVASCHEAQRHDLDPPIGQSYCRNIEFNPAWAWRATVSRARSRARVCKPWWLPSLSLSAPALIDTRRPLLQPCATNLQGYEDRGLNNCDSEMACTHGRLSKEMIAARLTLIASQQCRRLGRIGRLRQHLRLDHIADCPCPASNSPPRRSAPVDPLCSSSYP